MVDDRLRLRLDGEEAAGRLASEERAYEEFAVDRLAGRLRQRRHLDEAEDLRCMLDVLEVEDVGVVDLVGDEAVGVGRQGGEAGLGRDLCEEGVVVLSRTRAR